MTPASAKPETGRPGGGQRTSGCGPTPLPRPQHPVALPVSVLVCYWGLCASVAFPPKAKLTITANRKVRQAQMSSAAVALGSLPSATWVDETLLSETDRAIVIRFGRAADPLCQQADAQLLEAADELVLEMHAFAVELDTVPDFTAMYELHARQHGHQTPALARCSAPAQARGSGAALGLLSTPWGEGGHWGVRPCLGSPSSNSPILCFHRDRINPAGKNPRVCTNPGPICDHVLLPQQAAAPGLRLRTRAEDHGSRRHLRRARQRARGEHTSRPR